jgi:transcriptional regulator of acetoin/glycerol metabolism
MQLMMTYSWPGNVRELENTIEYAFVVCQSDLITSEDLPAELSKPEHFPEHSGKRVESTRPRNSNISRQELLRLLRDAGWNKAEVGRILGVSRTAVWKWMKKMSLPMNEDQDRQQIDTLS